MSERITKKRRHSQESDVGCSKTIKKGHWSFGLLSSMDDPNYFVQSDDLVTVIRDKYPKAEFHYLVIPRENISSLKDVTYKHLPLLKHMEHIGQSLAQISKRHFKMGYHAQPSMHRLHLHVISDDMNSSCLKTKKHWNSFNTDFFLDAKSNNNMKGFCSGVLMYCDCVIDISTQLEKREKLELLSPKRCQELLETPLICNKCSFTPRHIPELKKHLLTHL